MDNAALNAMPSLKDQIKFGLLSGLIYLLISALGIVAVNDNQQFSQIWFANAAMLGMLLRSDKNFIISGSIALILSNSIINIYQDHSMAKILIYSTSNLLEVITCFAIIKHYYALPYKIINIDLGMHTLIAVTIGCLVSSLIVGIYFYQSNPSASILLIIDWYISDLMGMIVILPVFLSATFNNVMSLLNFRQLIFFILFFILISIIWILSLIYIKLPLVIIMLLLVLFAYFNNFFRTSVIIFSLMAIFIMAEIFGLLSQSPLKIYYSSNAIHIFIALTFMPALIISLLMQQKNEAMRILQESEDRFNSILKYSTIGMSIVNIDGRFLKVNNALCQMTQYTEEELLTLRFHDITYYNDLDDDVSLASKIITRELNTYSIEKRYIKKDGELIWVLLSVSAVYDENDNFKYFLSQIENIDTRKRAEEEKARAMDRLKLALKTSNIGIWEYDFTDDHLIWDDEMFNIYDVSKETFTANKDAWSKTVHPDDIIRAEQELSFSLEHNKIFDTQFRILTKDNKIKYIRARANIIFDLKTNKNVLLGINWDVTHINETVIALEHEREKLHVTLQSIGDAVIVCDANGYVTFLNKIAERILNVKSNDAIGKNVVDLIKLFSDHDGLPLENPLIESVKLRKIIHLIDPVILINNIEQKYYIQDSAAPIILPDGELYGSILVFQDITNKRLLEKQMEYQASHDFLTGLLNRHEFENHLIKHIHHSENKSENNGYLCYMDLDKFKIVNDVAGHIAGDNLLHEVSIIIKKQVNNLPLARLGGDEFGLLISNKSLLDTKILCQNIIDSVSSFKFVWNDNVYSVGISIGIVPIPLYSPSIVDLFSKSDIACYTAKSQGRNKFCIYSEEDKGIVKYNTELQYIYEIGQALEKDQFIMYAQKIINLKNPDENANYYELLLRIIGEDKNIKLPSEYIIAAERVNLVPEIDKMVVRKVLAEYDKQIAAIPNLYIAINLSVDSIRNSSFLTTLIEFINHTTIERNRINFEITETAAMSKLALTTRFIKTVRNLGCTVSLDDFGSGISSYKYLKYCTVDYIKIDGDFIKAIDKSFKDLSIVKSINDIAHQFGAKTIAEHVDSERILEILKEIGVDYVQGYLLHKPVPLSSIFKNKS